MNDIKLALVFLKREGNERKQKTVKQKTNKKVSNFPYRNILLMKIKIKLGSSS